MKRKNSVTDALNTGAATIDLGDGLGVNIPLDGTLIAVDGNNNFPKPIEDRLEGFKWLRSAMPSTADFNDYTVAGVVPVSTSNGKANAPFAFPGVLHVETTGSTILQRYVTSETRPRTFERRRSGTTWEAWRVGSFLQGSIPSSANLDDYEFEGAHEVANTGTLNKPMPGTGVLMVFKIATITVQWFLTAEETPRQFTRRTSSSGWTPWQPLSWYQGAMIAGTDWNTLQAPGEWSITFLNHPNQPTASSGSLTIRRAGSEWVQEFTPNGDNPAVYRRRFTVAGWGTWSVRSFTATVGEATPSDGGPTRSPIQPWQPALTAVNPAQFITAFTKDRVVGFNGNNSTGVLRETRDGGQTWTDLHSFGASYGGVQQLDNGELLAVVQNDPAPRELWLSSGYSKGGTVTWSKVLTASGPYITFALAWSISTYKNMVFANEYGPKTGMQWLGNDVTKNARYTYMSLDHGKTWTTIFDLNSYLTGQQGRANADGVHLHGVAWDPYWDRIWVTFGDDVNGTVYSDDLGVTWQTAHYGNAFSSPHQNVGIMPMPKAVLFGSDGYPNGVQRINRTAGKHSGTYTIEQAYTINPGVNELTHLCQSIHKVEREGGDGPVLFGFGAETAVVPSCIVATYDGFTFTKFWEDTQSQAAGRGLRSIAGPNLKGELIVGSNDGRVANLWSKWQGRAHIY